MSDPDGLSPERIEQIADDLKRWADVYEFVDPTDRMLPIWYEAADLLTAQAATIAQLQQVLTTLLDHYTSLIDSGDCGCWDPEQEAEVKAALDVLRTKA